MAPNLEINLVSDDGLRLYAFCFRQRWCGVIVDWYAVEQSVESEVGAGASKCTQTLIDHHQRTKGGCGKVGY